HTGFGRGVHHQAMHDQKGPINGRIQYPLVLTRIILQTPHGLAIEIARRWESEPVKAHRASRTRLASARRVQYHGRHGVLKLAHIANFLYRPLNNTAQYYY